MNTELFPEEPGVYLMKDRERRILYIGKAKNLKSRIKQYFSLKGDGRAMLPYLMSQVNDIETILTLTEKDALILENQLIKRHQPKYNVLLKDDKTFISLLVTQHAWPMLRLIRYKGKPKEKGDYFGPYTNATVARATLELLNRMFPLRQCSDAEFLSRKRPCILYDMKKCIAPCVNLCTKTDYDKLVEEAVALLKGRGKDLLQELKKQRDLASERLEYEKAKELHEAIELIEEAPIPYQGVDPCDVLGLFCKADTTLIVKLTFREGGLFSSEHFSFHSILGSDEEVLELFLIQHYGHAAKIPPELLLPIDLTRRHELSEILSDAAGHPVSLLTPKKGKKHTLIEMALANASSLFEREEARLNLREKRLLDLQETLRLTRFPRRIDCVDTSHIAGSDAVASLVSFVNGEPDRSRSRLFLIKGGLSEDYHSMRQTLHRHFSKHKDDPCDLLIVDGGKGQLSLAIEVFQSLGIASIDLIALSKEEGRHDKGLTQEKVFLPHEKEPLLINPRSPTLFLLQTIRDEAHRRAIQFHTKRRGKRLIQSALDEIPGIGPVKKKALLRRFGSVAAIRQASLDELRSIPELTKKDLDALQKFIKKLE